MPDLLSHTIISRLITSFRWRRFALLFGWGTILPDILRSIPTFFFPHSYLLNWFVAPFHSPLLFFLIALLFSLSQKINNYFQLTPKQVFIILFLAMHLHLFLDLFQKHIQPSYFIFFPFSLQGYEIGLFWPETSLYLVLILVVLLGGISFLEKKAASSRGYHSK